MSEYDYRIKGMKDQFEPVIPISGKRVAICYPGNIGAKVIKVENGTPQELFDLSIEQLKGMADAKPEFLRKDLSEDDMLNIVITWMANR